MENRVAHVFRDIIGLPNWTSAVNVNVRKVSFMSKVCENNLTCVIYIIQRIQEVTAEYNFRNNDGRCKQMSIICASKVFG